MPRPRSMHPTPAELEILQILWERGPSTVREVLGVLDKERAYTSVMSLMNVMVDKKLVVREPEGRAYRYSPCSRPDQTQRKLLSDLLRRAFAGSASALVARLLEQSRPTAQELDAIQRLVADYQKQQGGSQ